METMNYVEMAIAAAKQEPKVWRIYETGTVQFEGKTIQFVRFNAKRTVARQWHCVAWAGEGTQGRTNSHMDEANEVAVTRAIQKQIETGVL